MNGIATGINRAGCRRHNILAERRRAVEHEGLLLRARIRISAAKARASRYVSCRNEQRPHRSLDTRTPDHVYFTSLLLAEAAQSAGASIETHPERLIKAAAAASSQTHSDERP